MHSCNIKGSINNILFPLFHNIETFLLPSLSSFPLMYSMERDITSYWICNYLSFLYMSLYTMFSSSWISNAYSTNSTISPLKTV
jgi:hypothetical protein